MNHCKKCGHELSPTAEFCGNCGEPVPKRKTAHSANLLIGIAVGVGLVLAIAGSLAIRAGKSAKPSAQTSAAVESTAAVSTEATAPGEPQYRQPMPTMIRITDDGQPWSIIRFTYGADLLMTEYSEEYFTDGAVDWTVQTSMTYDDQARLVRQDITRSDLTYEDGSGGYRTYRYDDAGNLIFNENKTFESWSKTTYVYDFDNRLTRTVEEYGPYTLTTDYIYDADGNVEQREESYDYGNGDIRKETQLGDGKPAVITDYKPFEFILYDNYADIWEEVGISIPDKAGQSVWYTLLSEVAELRTDENGYVTEIKHLNSDGTIRTYSIYYNGETPSEQSDKPVQPKASLSYPISLEDCLIIYRNFYGREMCKDNIVEACRATEDGENVLYFFIKDYFIKGEAPVTYAVFEVFVDSGKCTGGAESHSDRWPTFQAEDYYP